VGLVTKKVYLVRIRQAICLLLFWVGFISGCGGIAGSSVKPPSVNSKRAADKVIELYDKDSNGLLSVSELTACPALLAALANYDTDGDKQLSREEIVNRLTDMYSQKTGLTQFRCQILLDGRPLRGAHVRLIPEEFLGGDVKAADGDTDGSGTVTLGIADSDLPAKARGLKLMQLGVYRVEVTHPPTKIPSKYNTQTTLGYELYGANRDEDVVFRLQSK
jgi:hypothetical protein